MSTSIVPADTPVGEKDLTGKSFGSWAVLEYVGYKPMTRHRKNHIWRCRCGCGIVRDVRGSALIYGKSEKCKACAGRERETTHGLSATHPLYKTWCSMWARCTNPNNTNYKRYGAIGITVAHQWRDFVVFIRDVGERPSLAMSLDRINPSGNYAPENVRWATRTDQANNTRRKYAERM